MTARLSFMLSGAQLGITVTALLAGYVAEPYLGEGLADLLGVAGLPRGGRACRSRWRVALLFATVVQMVLGELAPKNLAIARAGGAGPGAVPVDAGVPGGRRAGDPAVRRGRPTGCCARSGIEPVEELPQGATAEDLDRIIAESRAEGLLDADTVPAARPRPGLPRPAPPAR